MQYGLLPCSRSAVGRVVTRGFRLLPSRDASISNAGHRDGHGSEQKRQHGEALAPVLEVVLVTSILVASILVPLAGTPPSNPNLTTGRFGIVAFLCAHKEDIA